MRNKFSKFSRALVTAGALAPLPAFADTPGADAIAEVQQSAHSATRTEVAQYAERDRSDKDAQTFEGGSAVIIASSGAIFLAFVLLLILL